MITHRRILQWTVLVGIATTGMGIVAAAAEWHLRRTVPIDWTQEHRVPHPVLGWTLEPGARYSTYVPELIRVVYNSDGWRDNERLHQAGPIPRIAVLGDSFMEAYSVDLEDAFSQQLERLARVSGHSVEVLNFGVGGYSTLQEYLVFTQMARTYVPRLVLVGFHIANDVRNNHLALESIINTGRAKVFSRPFLIPERDGNWTLTSVDIVEARLLYDTERTRRERWPLSDARKSVLLRLVGRVARHLPDLMSQRTSAPNPNSGAVDDGDLSRFGVHICDEPPEITEAWTLTARILERFRDDVRASGATLVLFTVPAVEEVSPSAMRAALASASHPELICLERAPGYDRLSNILTKLDIPLVDILPDFRAAAREQGADLFRHEGHWGPDGHALAAEKVLGAIDERQLLTSREDTQSKRSDYGK